MFSSETDYQRCNSGNGEAVRNQLKRDRQIDVVLNKKELLSNSLTDCAYIQLLLQLRLGISFHIKPLITEFGHFRAVKTCSEHRIATSSSFKLIWGTC